LAKWLMDDAGEYNNMALTKVNAAPATATTAAITAVGVNEGFVERHKWIIDGKLIPFNIPLLMNFTSLAKLWPHSSNIVIRLYRSDPSLVCLTKSEALGNLKIDFRNLCAKIYKYALHPKLYLANETRWLSTNFKYNYDKCQILEFSMKQGDPMLHFPDIYSGLLPKYFITAMCSTSALAGSYSENPFYFPHNNITEMYSKINGTMIPSQPYTFDFSANPPDCLNGYAALYDEVGINRAAKEHYISFEQYCNGAFIMPFSTCGDNCFGRNSHVPQEGTISLHLKFKSALASSFTLLVFMVWDEKFELDSQRKIVFSAGRSIH